MAIPNTAITRNEQYLAAMAGQSGTLPDAPITRKERYLAKAAGQDVETPPPITREEKYLDVIAQGGGGGGGGDISVVPLTATENKKYTAPSGTAYSPVTVNVPTPTPTLIPKTISANGIYAAADDSADGFSAVTVDVQGSSEPSEVPSGYTQLAYIETDGNSCIDTGMTWGANKKIVFSWAQDGGISFAQFASPFGSNVCFVQIRRTTFCAGANIKINDSDYGITDDAGIPMTPNTMTVTPNLITAGGYKVNAPTGNLYSQSGTVTTTGTTFAIGGRVPASGEIERKMAGTIIYRWKMYDNDTLIQDLVPAMRDSNDVIGMYDIVNNNFLTNAGSGSFTGGAL